MKRLVLLALTAALFAPAIHGQATFPTLATTESDGATALNLYNLAYDMQIGITTVPSRGLTLSPSLTYSSLIWEHGTGGWQPVVDDLGNPTWGWRRDANQVGRETPLYRVYRGRCIGNDGSNQFSYIYTDFHTADQTFSYEITIAEQPFDYPECGDSSYGYTSYGIDAAGKRTGYVLAITPSGSGISASVFAPSGSDLDANGTYHDTNGNSITESSGVWHDPLGRPAITVANNPTTHHTTYTYFDATHGTQYVDMTLTAKNVTTYFQCSSISEYSASSVYFPTAITLADGSSYTFDYELSTAPGHTSDTTGRISKITLPTGGYVQYSYTGTNCADGSPTNVIKTVNDLVSTVTWTYVRSQSGTTWTTTETTPAGNDIVSTFAYPQLITEQKVYQGTSTGGTPVVLSDTTTTYTGSSTSLGVDVYKTVGTASSHMTYGFDTYGNLYAVSSFDWGSATTSTPLTQTIYAYNTLPAYVAANLVSLPISKKVYQGTTILSYTEYFYDGLTASGSADSVAIAMVDRAGAIGHDDTLYSVSSTAPRGNLTKIIEYTSPAGTPSGGLVTRLGYDSLGNLVKVIDPKGNVTVVSYADSWDSGSSACSLGSGSGAYAYPTSVTLGYGSSSSLTSTAVYNKCIGATMASVDPNGAQTVYGYADPLLRTTGVRNPDVSSPYWSSSTSYSRYNGTSKASITSNVRHDSSSTISSTTTLDGLGRVYTVQGGNGAYVDYRYGFDTTAHQTVHSISNPYFSGTPDTTYSYADALGRPVKSIAADGVSTTTISYANNCSTIVDPESRNRKMCLDPLGRLVTVYEDPNGVGTSSALNYLTAYRYDALGNITNVCQGSAFSGTTCPSGSLSRTFSYDALGRQTGEITPEAGSTSLYYTDSAGSLCAGDLSQVCRRTDNLGTTTTYTYDPLNRLKIRSYSDSTSPVTYSYDQSSYSYWSIGNGKGHRTTMADASGTTMWSYDSTGRPNLILKFIDSAINGATYAYNADGTMDTYEDYNGDDYTFTYDSAGRPTSLAEVGGSTFAESAAYNAASQLTSLTHHPGTGTYVRSLQYNTLLQPSVISATLNGNTIQSLSYGYGITGVSGTNNGNVSSVTNGMDSTGHRDQAFTYDNLNRLLTAHDGTHWGETYSYDQWGNLTATSRWAGTSGPNNWTTSIYPSATNQLLNQSYNSDGQVSADEKGYSYTYDAEGRVMTVSLGSTLIASYIYDGDGNRVKKTASGNITLYLYGLDSVLDEADDTGNSVYPQLYFAGMPIWSQRLYSSGNFVFQDHLGSARMSGTDGGSLRDDVDYLPFGSVMPNYGTPSDNHYTFTGAESDQSESETSYNVFRNLNTQMGRFNRPDPYAGSYDFTNPQSLNRYSYALNNPLRFTDPLGLNESGYCSPEHQHPCDEGDDPWGGGGAEGGGGGGDYGLPWWNVWNEHLGLPAGGGLGSSGGGCPSSICILNFTDNNQAATLEILRKAFLDATAGRILGLWNMFRHSSGNGDYDYGYNPATANDTFNVCGLHMKAAEFGNFMAGFEGAVYDSRYIWYAPVPGGPMGIAGVEPSFLASNTMDAAGIWYHVTRNTTAKNDPLDHTGRPDIDRGMRYGFSYAARGPNCGGSGR